MTAFTSTQTGNWADGATWGNTSPGVAGTDYPWTADTATIATTHIVTYDTDNSATAGFGAVGVTGVLSIDKTKSTHLKMNANLTLNSGGELICGTEGSPLPEAYTFTLEFNCASDGQYGIEDGGTCTFGMYGSTPAAWTSTNVHWQTLSAAMSASDTAVYTNEATGWSAGDEVYILSSTRNQGERRTIDSISGTDIVLTSGVTYAHDDNAIIFNITRNIIITQTNNTYNTYIKLDASSASTFECSNVLFDTIGSSSYSEFGIWLRADDGSYLKNCVLYNLHRALTQTGFSAGEGMVVEDTLIAKSADKGVGGGGRWTMARVFFVETNDKAIDKGVGDLSLYDNCYWFVNGHDGYFNGFSVSVKNSFFGSYGGVSYPSNGRVLYYGENGSCYVENTVVPSSDGGIQLYPDGSTYLNQDVSFIAVKDFNTTAGDERVYKSGTYCAKETTEVNTPGTVGMRFHVYGSNRDGEFKFPIAVDTTGTLTLTYYYKFAETGVFANTRTITLLDEDGNSDTNTLNNSSTSWQSDTLSLSVVAGEVLTLFIELNHNNENKDLYISDLSYSVA